MNTRPAAITRNYSTPKIYSSNVLVLEYSFNSASGQKFQFLVPVFQIKKQLLELEFYANLAPSSWSCKFCDLIH